MLLITVRRSGYAIILIVAIVVVAIAAVLILTMPPSGGLAAENLSGIDLYAHLGNATFALIAPQSVLANSSQFIELAKQKYNFLYADSSNFTGVEKSQFVLVVANASEASYLQIAGGVLNATALNVVLNRTKGVILSKSNVWADNQTVFFVIGYTNSSALQSALLSFFVSSPVYAPRQGIIKFVNFSGNSSSLSHLKKVSKDPIIDAYLDGSYELGPYDQALGFPYNYYDQFAYLIYWAPVLSSGPLGLGGGSSGTGLPIYTPLCTPPPPEPDSTSLCIGDYVAMPMLQFGATPPQKPQWSYESGDCEWTQDCIDAEGWAASGLNPQLPYQDIPSVEYGFTATGSPIPPSMDGTSGPLSPYDPITWYYYGPGGTGLNTGGLIESNLTGQNETVLLENASVQIFSAPYKETPFGNFTGYNSTNSSISYACGAGYCGAFFDYAIYALMGMSTTLPKSVHTNSSFGPGTGYYSIFEPVTLTTPKKVRSGTTFYYFSYWSIYSEVGTNQYYQRYNTSSATFEVIGPAQAEAIYTTNATATSGPGNVTIYSDYIPLYEYGSCLNNPANCTKRGFYYQIPNVSVSISTLGGKEVFLGVTNTTASAVTGKLAGGCYNVAVSKLGYNLAANPNPLCVNGATTLFLIDTDPYIFNITWPSSYPYAFAPVNGTIPINVSVLDAGTGALAGNSSKYLYARVNSGIMKGYSSGRMVNGYSNLSAKGTAGFLWEVGKTPGIYKINFTVGVGWPTLSESYLMPVVAYSGNYLRTELNISLSNTTEHVSSGGSFTDNITVRLCRTYLIPNRTLPCIPLAPYAANMSLVYVNDRPANSTYAFMPNPATVNSKTLDDSTALHVSLGNGVRSNPYIARITATMATSNGVYNATVPLLMYVSQNGSTTTTVASTTSTTTITSGSGYGALNVTVFFNGAPAAAAQVRAFSPGVQSYNGWYTGSNGEYNTGFIITPGSYEVDATYDNITNSTNYLNVSAGKVTYVDIDIYGIGNTTTSTSTTSTVQSSTTTAQSDYYTCNLCYHVIEAGFSCPSTCPTSVSCNYGGFECT